VFDIDQIPNDEAEQLPAGRSPSPYRHIALVGNALPRKCGLATFTSHVADALHQRYPGMRVDHYAMDDGTDVAYPAAIRPIDAANAAAYRDAATRIVESGAEAIWLQHEYGIFGGEAGSHILELTEATDLPLIVTLHTVLENPDPVQESVLGRLAARAETLVVMAEKGAEILRRRYLVPADRIRVVPHGVPDLPFRLPDELKPRFGWQGRTVLMTFGLLAPNKGIRHMIEAMPAIVAHDPTALYAIVGATHPNLVRNEGESHREDLADLALANGVADHIQFIDRFVEQEELLAMLQASDVYVTPYLNMAQVTSGTLSYAVSAGKPVIATPYAHALELLADDHGVIVPPADSAALAEAAIGLLTDEERRLAMSRAAYAEGRTMLWPRVVERALARVHRPLAPDEDRPAPSVPLALPLRAVLRMTDDVGMLQHGLYNIPNRDHGYCIDDNVRALMLMVRRGADEPSELLAERYAAFVHHGWNPDTRRFRNFMSYGRQWLEDTGSDDSNGRTLWSLGVTAADARSRALRDWSLDLFEEAASAMGPLPSPRAATFAALGAHALLKRFPDHELAFSILREASGRLLDLHDLAARDGWTWFEARLAYDNARLPEMLIKAGRALGEPEMVDLGLATLDWLVGMQTSPRGDFRPVGCNGFGREYCEPLAFDQQPVEAAATIDAAAAAFEATGDRRWHGIAQDAFAWFFGQNDAGVPLADPADGSCFDGLMATGINRNQGAESILSFHLAALTMRDGFVTLNRAGQRNFMAAEAEQVAAF
jgi:glycosyltransferase involved in cell wall biosynthesis